MNTDKLKALALAATPGEWKVERLQGGGHHNVGIRVRGPIVSGFAAALNTRWANEAQTAEQEANAAYIAAACPATVLELIAERDELREEVERLQAARDQALEEAATVADAERAEFMSKAGDNNGRESDFAFGSVNSAERIAAAIRSKIGAAPAAGTEKDAERLAEGYESGFFASDPRDGDGQFTLHYKTAAQAEAAYMLVTSIIDAAIEAHSKAGSAPCGS